MKSCAAIFLRLLTWLVLLHGLTTSTSALAYRDKPSSHKQLTLLFGESRNEKGELIPIADHFTRILQHLEKDLGIQFQLQIYPWNRAVKLATQDGGLIFGLSLTPEREANFAFSEPALFQHLWLVTRADREFPFETLQDLKGKTIGVVRGSKYGGEFDAQKNQLFKVDDDIDAQVARLRKLLSQRIDAMLFASPISDAKEVEALVNAIPLNLPEPHPPTRKRFSVLAVPVLKDPLRFAILRHQEDGLIEQINRSLSKLNHKAYASRQRFHRSR